MADFVFEKWVVCASEDEEVDLRVFFEDGIEMFLDEIVGSGGCVFVVFDEGHPHGAGFAGEGDVWV